MSTAIDVDLWSALSEVGTTWDARLQRIKRIAERIQRSKQGLTEPAHHDSPTRPWRRRTTAPQDLAREPAEPHQGKTKRQGSDHS